MPETKADQVLDIISDGLIEFAQMVGDKTIVQAGAMAYRDTQTVFIDTVNLGDTCKIAFPSVVILPDGHAQCFVAVMGDKIIVAWRKGFFKKTTFSQVIPKSSIKSVDWEVSTDPSTRGASIATIHGASEIKVALPQGKPGVADAILAQIQK